MSVRWAVDGRRAQKRPYSFLFPLLGLLLLATIQGCVTHTDSIYQRDKERAERDYIRLGLAYIARNALNEARENLNRALEINPESAPATAAEGLIYQLQGENQLAEQHFRTALEYDPDYTRGRTYYGAFLYAQDRFEDAYEQFRLASEDTEFPDRAQVFVNLALCAARLGREEVAINAYKRALDIRMGHVEALIGLTRILVLTERYDEAAHYFDRLERLIVNSQEVRHTPATLLTGLRLARHQGDRNREASLALLLRNLYPESYEYQQYKAMVADD